MPPKTSVKEAQPLPAAQAEPKKKLKVKRLVIILAILLITLSGAGFGGYWWLYLRKPVDARAPAAADGGSAQGAAQVAGGPADKRAGPGETGRTGAAPDGAGGALIEARGDLPRSAGMVLPLPPVTVNLADPGGRRYLKLAMEVEVNGDVSRDIKAQAPRIRDAVIMLLAGKNYDDIATPDGKVLLKAEVAARLNQIFGAQRVIRVYFTDFVVE
ncbi:MAG: flagellar basal body-associated FliL family protein [Desulfovibrio sp.]|jgi:flagellar FliL protein|nr:flagellar basal body-associated FliL family protein [Desulfovibrio sp.]